MEDGKISNVRLINKDDKIYISYNIISNNEKRYIEELLYDESGNINVKAMNILNSAKETDNLSLDNKKDKRNKIIDRLTLYGSLRKYKKNKLVTCKKQKRIVASNINNDSNQMNGNFIPNINTNFDNIDLSDVVVAKAYMITVPDDAELYDSNKIFLVKPVWEKSGILGKEKIIGYKEIITQQLIIKKVMLKPNPHMFDDYGPIFTVYKERYVEPDTYYKKKMYLYKFVEENQGKLVWRIYDKLSFTSLLTSEEIFNYLNMTPEEITNDILNLKEKAHQLCSEAHHQYVLTNKYPKYKEKSWSFNTDF